MCVYIYIYVYIYISYIYIYMRSLLAYSTHFFRIRLFGMIQGPLYKIIKQNFSQPLK